MSDASRRMGRPPDPETQTRARHFLDLNSKYDVPVKLIAEREGLTASRVWELLKTARAEIGVAGTADGVADGADQARPAAASRKISEAALLRRAWLLTHTNGRLRGESRAVRSFWVDLVLVIREEGDGCCLRFAETGYRDYRHLATVFEGSEDDLALLFSLRLLVEIEAGGIGLPAGMGLMRGERSGGPMPARSRSDRRQGHMLQVLTGGLPDSSEVPSGLKRTTPFESCEVPTSLESESSEVPVFGATYLDSDCLARAADADALSKLDQSSSISISPGTPPRTTQAKSPTSHESESSEVGTADASDPGKALPASSGLAHEMKGLIKPGRVPNAGEIGRVQGWLEAGDSAAAIRAVIEGLLKGGAQPATLHYFDEAVREARKARQQPRAAVASAGPQVSEADQALKALLKPANDAWLKDRSCPFPPNPKDFEAAGEGGDRWLTFWHAWDQAGRPDRLKPPEFTALTQQRAIYDARMLEIEDALTEPEDSS